MQPANKNQTKQKSNNHTIWLLTSFLTVLVIASAAVLGMCLYVYANPSDSKIDLYKGEEAEQSNQIIKRKTINQNKSSSHKYTGNEAKQQAKKQGLYVKDNTQVWTTDTEIDLFKVSYKNNKGEITVKSASKDKVIAPGTNGSYTFDLKNTSKKSVDYKIWVETSITSNIKEIPLQTRMFGAKGWLLGSKNNWKDADKLDGITTTETLGSGKTAQYKIYWQWPFEQGKDAEDTNLGNISANEKITYKVVIHTLTAATTNTDNPKTNTPTNKKPVSVIQAIKTGDTAQIMKWAILLGFSAGIILILIFWKRKKEENKEQA